MYQVNINNEINLTYPDGFSVMNEEALTRYFTSAQNRWGVYHEDKHIILSVSWTKAGGFRKPSNPESMLIAIESRLCRNLLNYQKIGEFQTKIGKQKAYGVRFSYRVNDKRLVQVADLFVFKHKKNLYAVHYITRQLTAAEDRQILQEVLGSVVLV